MASSSTKSGNYKWKMEILVFQNGEREGERERREKGEGRGNQGEK